MFYILSLFSTSGNVSYTAGLFGYYDYYNTITNKNYNITYHYKLK